MYSRVFKVVHFTLAELLWMVVFSSRVAPCLNMRNIVLDVIVISDDSLQGDGIHMWFLCYSVLTEFLISTHRNTYMHPEAL